MALPARDQVRYWSIAAILLGVVLWLVGDILMPFVLGAAFAYLLDPIADRLQAMGLGRAAATTLIMLTAILVLVLGGLLVVPALINQTIQFTQFIGQQVESLPDLIDRLNSWLADHYPALSLDNETVRQQLAKIGETIQDNSGALLSSLLTVSSSVLGIVMLLVIVPVVTFYLLMDWDRMVSTVDDLLPRDHAPTIRTLAGRIDRTLAGFIRGMGSVCLILGMYYALALWALGLQFGLVIGLIAGLLTFIPYVGAIVGGVLAIGMAFFQFWNGVEVTGADGTTSESTNWIKIILVWAVFQSGQFIEGNVLTPKLVGSSVGLHPVWLILALSVFGALFGFVGLLVAVPVAAVIGVLIRFFVTEYKTGRLYRGLAPETDEARAEDAPAPTAAATDRDPSA
ncbi:MAG: putative permease [Rhodobacteraceae bacterium HLUCCA08]|nr:MAG: putative permease [Rhodobacteraceae bacterium HLUCCA08]